MKLSVYAREGAAGLRELKAIRWKVTTTYGNGEPVYDVAPDRGMYG